MGKDQKKEEDLKAPLLLKLVNEKDANDELGLWRRIKDESKMLWVIAGPAIFTRVATYGMTVVTQAAAGHLGELELAALSIAHTLAVGFNYGLMLGMASALETLCGQTFGAKKHKMLGIYMQRAWIVLFFFALLLVPFYFLATPVLIFMGQPLEIAEKAGKIIPWFLPVHFSYPLLFPLQRFLQCQLKNMVNAYTAGAAFLFHIAITWVFIFKMKLGLAVCALTLGLSWWVVALLQFGYVMFGGCPHTWTGFSMEAFANIWEFIKLSVASGVMICLETWYYRILILITGNFKNATIAIDALTICMNINSLELMIPLAFFGATGVRVANELGAGNGKGAKFATKVSAVTSFLIGLYFCGLIMGLHDKIALIFTTSDDVVKEVDKLAILLALTILLNSVQPVLSGVAVGSGWQSIVAYVNIGSYYLIGIPFGFLLGWYFSFGVLGMWSGMVGGTAVQTLILTIIIMKCDWNKEALKATMRVEKEANIN